MAISGASRVQFMMGGGSPVLPSYRRDSGHRTQGHKVLTGAEMRRSIHEGDPKTAETTDNRQPVTNNPGARGYENLVGLWSCADIFLAWVSLI